jgi:hypothetical protein
MTKETFLINAIGVVIWVTCTVWWTVGMTA